MTVLGKIVIQTDGDFTPPGKRTARAVQGTRGRRFIRWYVGGRIYRSLAITPDNIELTRRWIEAETQ